MVIFLMLFLILLLEAYLINYFLIHSFLGSRWRIFVAPGVILHECTHALACFVTGAKIVKISFFDKQGGSVTHHKPFIPILGPILISLAPLVVGILVFYYLARLIHLETAYDFQSIYLNFNNLIHSFDWSNWVNIVIIYLLLGVAVTMTPSQQDLINIVFPAIFIVALSYIIVRYTSSGEYYFVLSLSKIIPVLNLVIFILLVLLILSFALFFMTKFILKR